MTLTRRSLLLGFGAALAAPAVVRASSLMPLWAPPKPSFVVPLSDSLFGAAGPLRKPLYYGEHTIVGSYYDRPDGMTVYEYDMSRANPMFVNRGTGTVDNATMFNILLIDNIRPYRDRPYVRGGA